MSEYCTCLSFSRDPLCFYHGDKDKVAALFQDECAKREANSRTVNGKGETGPETLSA